MLVQVLQGSKLERQILMSLKDGAAALLRACQSSGHALQHCHLYLHLLSCHVDAFGFCVFNLASGHWLPSFWPASARLFGPHATYSMLVGAA